MIKNLRRKKKHFVCRKRWRWAKKKEKTTHTQFKSHFGPSFYDRCVWRSIHCCAFDCPIEQIANLVNRNIQGSSFRFGILFALHQLLICTIGCMCVTDWVREGASKRVSVCVHVKCARGKSVNERGFVVMCVAIAWMQYLFGKREKYVSYRPKYKMLIAI